MPRATVVVPACNVAATLPETLDALAAQTLRDFEIVVVDDGSTDDTAEVAAAFARRDPRLRVVRQANRGLAGARNSGIAAAQGDYIGFCDADDLWEPGKLAAHVAHLDRAPEVGISYSGAMLIDAAGRPLGVRQRPRLRNVTPAHVFRRNPIGNGSAPVVRRVAFDEIAWRPRGESRRDWWFDETFRQSEDIEAWLRFALLTDWDIEGVPGLLLRYRIVGGGLSAAVERQFAAWERMVAKLAPLAPDFFARHTPAARAYQLRYLARRAVSNGDAAAARGYAIRSLAASPRPLLEEPAKSAVTLAAAMAGPLAGAAARRASLVARAGA
jgi:glycosyltransferase involved in cell wall biosynthesis